jgi:hypothetical protein
MLLVLFEANSGLHHQLAGNPSWHKMVWLGDQKAISMFAAARLEPHDSCCGGH